MGWFGTRLLRGRRQAEPQGSAAEPQREAGQAEHGPSLMLLVPDAAGLTSFRVHTFPEAKTAAEFIQHWFPRRVKPGVVALWALHRQPEDASHTEVVVLIRDALWGSVVYLFSFAAMSSALTFLQEEVERGLDLGLALLYWGVPVAIHTTEMGTVRLSPARPPSVTAPEPAPMQRPSFPRPPTTATTTTPQKIEPKASPSLPPAARTRFVRRPSPPEPPSTPQEEAAPAADVAPLPAFNPNGSKEPALEVAPQQAADLAPDRAPGIREDRPPASAQASPPVSEPLADPAGPAEPPAALEAPAVESPPAEPGASAPEEPLPEPLAVPEAEEPTAEATAPLAPAWWPNGSQEDDPAVADLDEPLAAEEEEQPADLVTADAHEARAFHPAPAEMPLQIEEDEEPAGEFDPPDDDAEPVSEAANQLDDIVREMQKTLRVKRWERKAEEPFQGFGSPPGKF